MLGIHYSSVHGEQPGMIAGAGHGGDEVTGGDVYLLSTRTYTVLLGDKFFICDLWTILFAPAHFCHTEFFSRAPQEPKNCAQIMKMANNLDCAKWHLYNI